MEATQPASTDQHIVYKKDGEGNTMAIGEVVYENRIFQYPAMFPKVDFILNNVKDFPRRKDDVWIIGFAKSGSNWLNEILNLLVHQKPSVLLVDKVARMLEASVRGFQHFEEMQSPRILNTHLNFSILPRDILEKDRVIYIIRNPKSVAVSSYHYIQMTPAFEYSGSFTGYLPVLMKGLDDYQGSWFDHVTKYWDALRHKENALILFYEDLKKDPIQSIKAVSEFLGLRHEDSFIEKIAEETSFEAMQNREQLDPISFKQCGGRFFRKGTVTDWKSHFTVAQNEMFDSVYEEKMKPFPELKNKIQFS